MSTTVFIIHNYIVVLSISHRLFSYENLNSFHVSRFIYEIISKQIKIFVSFSFVIWTQFYNYYACHTKNTVQWYTCIWSINFLDYIKLQSSSVFFFIFSLLFKFFESLFSIFKHISRWLSDVATISWCGSRVRRWFLRLIVPSLWCWSCLVVVAILLWCVWLIGWCLVFIEPDTLWS